jgi:hypothetical protein
MMDQVISEVMQYVYPSDVSNFYFLNKTIYKDTTKTREKLKLKGRRSLTLHKDQEFRVWYRNGQLRMKGNKSNNSQLNYGYWQWWWENGQLMRESTYSDNHIVGDYTTYFEDGRIRKQGNIFNQHTIWEKIWDENGVLIRDYKVSKKLLKNILSCK